ncbi:MAG: enoyl-CoA hydratase/isomerase family protein [Acuticoccus sp.]
MSDVRFDTAGRAGLITLDRPRALNALTLPMVDAMAEALEEWAADDRIARVAIRAEGKAFCAGGDVRDVYVRREDASGFFANEYRLNTRIKTYPKPYVALLDGVTMGGGVGVSMHGSHVVASENLVFALPETGIGLFPDVGSSHLLSRLPGGAGMHLGLTGQRLRRDAAAVLGLVTHPAEAARLGDTLDRIAHARDIDAALAELVVETEPREAETAEAFDRAFAGDSVAQIVERLGEEEVPAAADAAAAIAAASPTSLSITFEAIRRAKDLSFPEAMRMEFRIVSRVLRGHDLYEGIRATLIDKDRSPQWSPATLDGIAAEALAAHFDEAPEGDLDLGAFDDPGKAS